MKNVVRRVGSPTISIQTGTLVTLEEDFSPLIGSSNPGNSSIINTLERRMYWS